MRPIDLIVVHHSASREGTHTWEDICRWHQAKGWTPPCGYHFGVVFDDGRWQIKTGRSLDLVGAHAKGFNESSVGVCFEGNYELNELEPAAYTLGLRLIDGLCTVFNVWPDNVRGHWELPYATACPGKHFPLEKLRADLRTH